MPTLKQIVEDQDTIQGRLFDFFIQCLIILSLITFSIETLPDLSDRNRAILDYVEYITIGIFTLEYLLRLYVAHLKLAFIFSFYGLLDLMAILPFYIASGIDLRSVRAFRLLRLVRVFKLHRYNRALKRLEKAFMLVKEEITLFFMVTLILLFFAAVGIYHFENPAQPEAFASIFDSLWWAIVTLTTVGYGDIYPITMGGRIFTFFIMLIGLGIMAIPTGLIAAALAREKVLEEKEKDESSSHH